MVRTRRWQRNVVGPTAGLLALATVVVGEAWAIVDFPPWVGVAVPVSMAIVVVLMLVHYLIDRSISRRR